MNFEMKPSTMTHGEESRMDIMNLLLVFLFMVAVPYGAFLLTSNLLISTAFGIIIVGALMDIQLTRLGLARGFREGNFYRVILERLGGKVGLVVIIGVSLIIRAVIIALFPDN